ncbi:MAG: vitamin K epoxide reductase family protein [Solirubrobacterales bacterium]
MKIPTEATLRRVIAFVATIGIGVATYIAIVEGSGGAPACVAGGGGCETVAESSYSHILGINIAIFGIIGYVFILLTAFLANDAARFGGFLTALGGFGFSVYLTYLEIWVIEAICQWCVASAVLMTILFILNAARLIGYAGTEPSPPPSPPDAPEADASEMSAA